jgi:hypothetical protein
VTVQKPDEQPIMLRRIELNSAGSGAHFLRSGLRPMNVKVERDALDLDLGSRALPQRDGARHHSGSCLQGRAFFDGTDGTPS